MAKLSEIKPSSRGYLPEGTYKIEYYNDGKIIASVKQEIYELKENLRNEFKRGTFSMTYNVFYEPIFTNLEDLDVNYCDSKKVALIRVADIIANHIYYEATNKNTIKRKKGLFLLSLPSNIIVCNGLDLFNK